MRSCAKKLHETVITAFLQAGAASLEDLASSQPGNAVERDGLYWTAKFMADATSAATASDPHWGLEGGMTPLAAVFASKWRQQVWTTSAGTGDPCRSLAHAVLLACSLCLRAFKQTCRALLALPQWYCIATDSGLAGANSLCTEQLVLVCMLLWVRLQARQQAAQHHAQEAAAQEEAAESKAYAAMEEMLGKAAARSWKAARDNAAGLASTTGGSSKPGPAGQSSNNGSTTTSSNGAAPWAPSTDDTAAAATVVAGASEPATPVATALPSLDSTALNSPSAAAAAPPGAAEHTATVTAEASNASSSAQCTPCSPRTAAAAAAQLLAAAAAASDPVEAVKLHLAALGVKDPADVSRTLMGELGARANLEGLLHAVAGYLETKGLPRRLNKKSSLKITKELNKR